MSRYKVGDKVTCLKGGRKRRKSFILITGRTYTVTRVTSIGIDVDGSCSNWDPKRFKKEKP